jgi:hypothetical protein
MSARRQYDIMQRRIRCEKAKYTWSLHRVVQKHYHPTTLSKTLVYRLSQRRLNLLKK